ncbi:MAG: carbon-nitrogen hydrolase family protein [Pseudomonadota bacterium]
MPVIAAAAYPLSPLADWAAYETKLTQWVADAAERGAELLVFPEYGGAEIATIGGEASGTDHFGAIDAITSRLAQADDILAKIAAAHGVWIIAGSAPIREDGRILNRARVIGPNGERGVQDKLMPTRWEREALGMVGGDDIAVFATPLGRFGVSTCYDAEFPLIARAMVEAGVQIILAPSCTETTAGYWRVRIGAMARALEGQCWAVHAPLIGDNDWAEMVEENTGAAGVYGPPDLGFPETGVAALGEMDAPGWTISDCDLEAVRRVRRDGGVLNWAHWSDQGRFGAASIVKLT